MKKLLCASLALLMLLIAPGCAKKQAAAEPSFRKTDFARFFRQSSKEGCLFFLTFYFTYIKIQDR